MQNHQNNAGKKEHNVSFYTEILKDPTYHLNIKSLQGRRGNYQFLESRHAYIQWLFPNHYHSKFNYNSFPLSQSQAVKFRTNPRIGQNIIFSYQMIMDFMGIKLKSVRTGEIGLLSQERLKNVLIKNTHNHLRLMRIIACLSTVGFRMYGLNLIKFLEQTVNTPKFSSVKNTFLSKWKVYEQDSKAVNMCFLKDNSLLNVRNAIFENQQQLDRIQNMINQIQEPKAKTI